MPIDNIHSRVRTASLAILFIFLVVMPVLSQSKDMPLTGSKDAVALYMQGVDKIENLEDPGTLFDQAIEADPNMAMAYLFAGRTNKEFRDNVAKAVALADKVSPGEKEWILAVKEQSEGNPVGRKAHLDQLLKLHPNDKRVHSQLGFYYRSIGDDMTALKHFNESVRIDKTYAPAYNNIGYSNIALGKFPDAEKAFKTYIALIPKNPNPYDSYAEMLMKTGKYDESVAQYNKALSVDPTFFNSYRGIGTNYVYKGDYNKAREAYQMMYDKAPDDAGRDLALQSMMNSYIAEGNTAKALEMSERRAAMAQKAGDVAGLIQIHGDAGFMLLEAGKTDEAAAHFAKADELRNDPSLPAANAANRRFGGLMNQTQLMIAKGDLAGAKANLTELRKIAAERKNPNLDRAANAAAGMIELKEKNYTKALESFAKADQNDPYLMYYRAAAYDGAGNTKMATELYSKVADWNQLDDTGHALVRTKAVSRNSAMAKAPKKP